MDEINATKTSQEPKKNAVLFFVLGAIIVLIIVGGGYIWWETQSGNNQQNNQSGQGINNGQTGNQSVLNIFGQIEKIEGQNITVKDGNTDQSMTFAWADTMSVSKENLNSEGFSNIIFSDLKKGQTISVMYQNDQQKTPLSIVLMGGTNLAGEVLEVTNNQIQVKSQQDTFLIKIGEQTNIVRLGQNGKMENNLPITEIEKGNFVAVVAESGLNTDEKTVTADKIEIMPEEK